MSNLKISFFKVLNLAPITAETDSHKIDIDYDTLLCRNLLSRNNNVRTGYEHFYIKKGMTKLYPFKDFDFIGKKIVCQKCFKIFLSKMSYKEHIGTTICDKTYKRSNEIYLIHKNANRRKMALKQKKKKSRAKFGKKVEQKSSHKHCYNKNDEPCGKIPKGRPRMMEKYNEDIEVEQELSD